MLPLDAQTSITMTVPQAWGIIVAICAVFGGVIIILVKIVLNFWKKRLETVERGQSELAKGQDKIEEQQGKITASIERTAEILKEVQESVKSNTIRSEELKDKVNGNEMMTRQSTHDIRTMIGTEYVTVRSHEKLQDRVTKLEIDMPRQRRQND